jgi:regulator of PEP synthase PpsR (kinase-PPPase family)
MSQSEDTKAAGPAPGTAAGSAGEPVTEHLPERRTVFFLSDRTGITAEMLGNSLLTQFENVHFRRVTIPFVDTRERVAEAIREVNETGAREGRRPLVFSSIVDDAMSQQIHRDANALTLDLFKTFLTPLEQELGAKSAHAAGRAHGLSNLHDYFIRMEAINFTQTHDDGAATRDLSKAQVVLVGVSRCGKTPTSLYLALQFGVRAANFPLTPDDFAVRKLPGSVVQLKDRLYGLTIQPERLREIREERRPGSHYASLENCRYEVREAENLMQREKIPMLDTTTKSIEEIAATILHRAKLERHIN